MKCKGVSWLSLYPFPLRFRDCNALFDTFLKAFFKKSACGEVHKEAYDEVLALASHEVPESGVSAVLEKLRINMLHATCYPLMKKPLGHLLKKVQLSFCTLKNACSASSTNFQRYTMI